MIKLSSLEPSSALFLLSRELFDIFPEKVVFLFPCESVKVNEPSLAEMSSDVIVRLLLLVVTETGPDVSSTLVSPSYPIMLNVASLDSSITDGIAGDKDSESGEAGDGDVLLLLPPPQAVRLAQSAATRTVLVAIIMILFLLK